MTQPKDLIAAGVDEYERLLDESRKPLLDIDGGTPTSEKVVFDGGTPESVDALIFDGGLP